MHHLIRRMAPETARQLLTAADDALLVVIGCAIDHAQDFQHRAGEIRIPAAGAEPDLAEDLAILERAAEGRRAGDEAIEGALVPDRHQGIPDRLDFGDVAAADCLLHRREARLALQRIGPGACHAAELIRQIGHGAGIPGLVLQLDHGAGRGRRQRIGKGLGLEIDEVHVVEEGRSRGRKAHGAEFGDVVRIVGEGLRAHPAADLLGFVDDRLEAELHQLIGGNQSCNAGADDGDFLAQPRLGQLAQPGRMADPIVIGEGKIRAEHGQRMRLIGGPSLGHRNRCSHGSLGWLLSRTRNTGHGSASCPGTRNGATHGRIVGAPFAGNLCRMVYQGSGMLAVWGIC